MNSVFVRDQEPIQQQNIANFPVFDTDQWSLQFMLNQFSPISLEQLGEAALMNRLETKYIFRGDQIYDLLSALGTEYRILEINGQRICRYQTMYYDTSDFQFFLQHHNGSGQRWKIRRRTYLDSRTNFLEVKYKDNRKRTSKSRIQTELDLDPVSDNENTFLSANAPRFLSELHPKLEVRFTRATLVKSDSLERVTLDSQLYFTNGKITRDLIGLMIAEIKQAAFDPVSPFMVQIKTGGVRPSPFSKYCIGTSLIYPEIKHNKFKPILHQVSNLLEGDYPHERAQ